MRPADGRISPAIRRNSVVLPAPFGPMTETRSPSPRVSETASTATHAAEATADAVDDEGGRAGIGHCCYACYCPV